MQIIVSLICGLIMSAGLIISGMVDPKKVRGFLDISGSFDPTLGFVMAGALIITAAGYRWIGRCAKPVLCECFNMPVKNNIDKPLIVGAAIFGTGWGLAGFCPAPAIAGIGLGIDNAFMFVLAMLAGMCLAKIVKTFAKF